MTSDIDYAALFAATATPYLVLDPDLIIVGVNQAYLALTGRTRQDLVGRHIFEAFPDNPGDPNADGVRRLTASLRWVLDTRRRDTMALLKYDIPVLGHPGMFEERWWSPVNTPVLAPDGSVRWILHRSEDVTAFVEAHRAQRLTTDQDERDQMRALQAELYARAVESQQRNEELREAHARAHEVALTLQEVMLRTPDLPAHRDVAVRYLPASTSLNVCGDWYEIVDLPHDNTAVAVGDVVGHGLGAAAVMGMLRSALSTAIRAIPSPAPALEILGLYARSIEGALGTTVVSVLIDRRSHLIIYSNAGHPPPVLAHTGRGSYELLDQATDPPLCVRPLPVPRPQASGTYAPGDVLVLYTDGLIERRGEDIDSGLGRLTDAVTECRELDVEVLADTLLTRLDVSNGGPDDIALVVVRL
ncbi:SpoIIE family protein phosphatase [Frankia sp. CNm7]|uniref:SpoIIE family protein phosphatase n=1 Tax=Frankia nepalensis TaxID=1836974 RepID=A0A937RIJ5_9ACTN|nr:SpoIIE family protein phosphatase [Frankia nepalensis]MBL7500862.1 SpoIIE family protein phosphatase [Frankia nepalensis]MBL7509228.1 SpoIIE family protein phosphatase [Frankia nepalensis]MBL7517312.1 SpoIIE family protein phosphatase [Frankia nepalensis]MBL7627008.1 SpoIIE family protein phosphatase [Frankia nepalensis]